MKKIITIVVTLLIGFTAAAQKKGSFAFVNSIAINGGTDISSVRGGGANITNKVAKPTQFFIGTGLDYFIIDKLAITGRLRYGLDRLAGNTDHYFSVNPGARYYIPLVTNKLFYTPGANLAVGFQTDKKDVGFAFGLNIDLAVLEYKPIEKLGITMNLGNFSWDMVTFTTVDKSSGTTIRTKETEHNVSLRAACANVGLGVKFYF